MGVCAIQIQFSKIQVFFLSVALNGLCEENAGAI